MNKQSALAQTGACAAKICGKHFFAGIMAGPGHVLHGFPQKTIVHRNGRMAKHN